MASELDDYVTALAAVNTGEKSPRVSVGLVTQQEPQAAPSELDQYVTGLGKARPDAAAQIAETKNPWEMDLGAPAQSSPTADAKQPKASERTWWQASDDMWHHFDAGAYIAVRDALHGIGKLNESHRLSQLEYEKKRPSIFRLLGMPSFADRPSLLEWVGPESDTYKALSGMAEGNLLDVTDVQKQREQQAQQQIEAARKQGGELSGFLEAGKQNLTNPSILVDNVAGMMPALGATIATTAVNPVLGATTGAAIFGGGAASGTYEAVYQAARDQGMTEDQARAAAQDSSNRAGMVGALVGAGGTLIGPAASIAGRSAPALSTVIANAAKNPLAAGALTAGKDLAAGEAMTLAPHIAQNVEVGKIDGQTPWYQDVGPVAGQTAATFLPISLAGGARATRDASKLRQARTEARDATQEAARQPEQTEAQRPPETQDRAQERDQAKAAPGRFDYGDYGKYRDALESGRMGDDAANTNSSALGRHQFVDGTWLDLIGRYKPEWADGLTRAELLELRKDQAKSAEMVAHFDQENAQALRLDGMPVTNETLYASHHFGPGKGVQFAKAGGDTPMADILTPGQMRANPYLDGLTKDQAIANWNRRAGKAGTDVAAGEARAAARAERGPADESARVAEREAGPEADLAVEAEPPKAEADDALPSMAREDVAGEAEIPETPTPTERAAQAEPQDRAARRQAQDGGEPADAVSQETTPAAQDAPNPVQAALARIANGEGVRDVLAGMPDAVARDTANAMGRDFAETAKASNIAEFMGKLPASDLAQRAQRAVVVQDPVKALRELAEMARTNGNENKTVTLGVVSDKLASVLRGQNVPVDSGFTHTADMFAVRHAINRHGDAKVEKAQGQLALTASDVASFHSAINRPDAYIIGAKNPRKQDVVGYLKRLSDGNLLYLEEVRTGRRSLAMASARKYPGTTDFETIRNRIVPSYARSDTGDVRIVYQDGGRGQAAATAAGAVTDSKATGHLGRDSVPLSEGGKPFKTRAQAAQAKAMQPSMRVVRADGGWALANKTPAQLAAQAKAARRLAMASTGKAGQPIAAHEFIAGEGGLSRAVASDLGVEGNPRVGNRWLYAGKGKGLTIEQATEKLREAGYIRGDSHNEALDVIRRSLKEPQYTPEGWDRIAEAEAQTRFEDHLAARQEEMGDTELAREQALEDHAVALGDEMSSKHEADEYVSWENDDIPWDSKHSNASHEDAMRALGFTEQEIQDEIANRSGKAQEDSGIHRSTDEDGAGGAQSPRSPQADRNGPSDSKTPDARQADVATGDAKLTSYSEADLRQREQQRQAGETERQRQAKDDEQRARADAERGDFTMTGSDRPADEAEAHGQKPMFSRGNVDELPHALGERTIEPVSLSLDGWSGTRSQLRELATGWYSRELQGHSVHNDDMGVDVHFTSEGKNSSFGTSGNLRQGWRAEMVKALPGLVKRAVKMGESAPDARRQNNTKAFHTLVAPLKIGDRLLSAKITLREAIQDFPGKHHKFYDIAAFEIGNGPELSGAATSRNSAGPLHPTGSEPSRVSVQHLVSAMNGGEERPMFSRSTSTKTTYEKRIDALFAGAPADRVGVKVLDRSDALGLLGYPDKPVLLQESKVLAGQDNHPKMTAAVWKKVPEWIENPAAVFASDTSGGMVFIAPETVAGRPVSIIVRPDTQGRNALNAHLLLNAYDRGTETPFTRWMSDGLMRYADQKKFPALLETVGGRRLPATAFQNKPGTARILTEKNLAGWRRANQSQAGNESASETRYARGERAAGMPTDAVQTHVDAIKSQWKNAPEIEVVRNMADPRIPDAVRAEEERQRSRGARGNVEGFFRDGKVYVLADHLASPADVARVVLHESIGHYGLHGVFGEKLGAVLDQLAWQRRGELAAKAREYGLVPDHVPADALPGRVYDAMDKTSRRLAAEEMLADLAAKQPQLGFVKRSAAAIRTWLRENIPGFKNLALSDAEIVRDIIMPARRFVREGPQAKESDRTAFSRTPDTKAKYEARIDELFAAGGKAREDGVRILDRSDVLSLMNLGDGPVKLAEGKVIAGQANHPKMTAALWKKVPDWLENPAAVFDSDTVPGRLVFVAPELVDGATARLVLDPNVKDRSGGATVHLLINAYDAPGRSPFGRWINDGKARFIDQKEFPAILTRLGLQLPNVAFQNKPGMRRILTEKNLAGWRKANSDAGAGENTAPKDPGVRFKRTDGTDDAAKRADELIHTPARGQVRVLDRMLRFATNDMGLGPRDAAGTKKYSVEGLTKAVGKAGVKILNMAPERIKAGLVSDYGVPEAAIDARTLMWGRKLKLLREAGGPVGKLAALTNHESQLAYDWMTGRDPDAAMKALAELPQDSIATLKQLREMVDGLSREAVELGILDARSYERNKGAYLHRSYLKHALKDQPGDGGSKGGGKGAALLGQNMHARGIFQMARMDRIKPLAPHWWDIARKDGKADPDLIGRRLIRMERRAPSGEGTQTMPGMDGKPKPLSSLAVRRPTCTSFTRPAAKPSSWWWPTRRNTPAAWMMYAAKPTSARWIWAMNTTQTAMATGWTTSTAAKS